VYNIMEDGEQVGTITEGSAVVTFPVAFADRFANGTHKIELQFTDATGKGVGKADLVVDRTSGGDNGSDPAKGPAILPQTGDDMPVGVLVAIAAISLGALVFMGLFFGGRRRKKA
jgi:LPXTG-motif cell wall-anchored protein